MPTELIDELRAMRGQVEVLSRTQESDLRSFLHERDPGTFRRLPTSLSPNHDVSVATTCTALMALCLSSKVEHFYKDRGEIATVVMNLLQTIFEARWKSSGLDEDNAFTRCMVLRACGFGRTLLNERLKQLEREFAKRPKMIDQGDPDQGQAAVKAQLERLDELADKQGRTVRELMKDTLKDAPDSFRILFTDPSTPGKTKAHYPPSPSIAYWLVDALDSWPRLEADPADWKKLAEWTSRECVRQISLVEAKHDAMMDPVAMVMSVCLAARLRRLATDGLDRGIAVGIAESLPPRVVLEHAIDLFFSKQADSGIWPKYFPMFHYPNAGANYTFSLEVLEAIVAEFKDSYVLKKKEIRDRLRRSLVWCEQNRLTYPYKKKTYSGWNSGGQVETLNKGEPECWATAVVHMFLFRLHDAVTQAIEEELLNRYDASRPQAADDGDWNDIVDSEVTLPGESKSTVRALVERMEQAKGPLSIGRKLSKPRSAVLFGPPGTSKTKLVTAFAQKMRWPCVSINPSHFLDQGLEKIYIRANQIFEDLKDLSCVVVFFDEMDGFVQRRNGESGDTAALDATRQFLTTSMLPKLAELHERGRVLFFMATNYRKNFDDAITRPGRFDLLLFLGPPSWQEKLKHLEHFGEKDKAKRAKVKTRLTDWTTPPSRVSELLDRFTFGDLNSFFRYLRNEHESLADAWDEWKESAVSIEKVEPGIWFCKKVEEWGSKYITLHEHQAQQNLLLVDYESDKAESRIQY